MPFSWEESGASRGDKDLQGNTTNTHTGGKEQLPGFADTWGKGQSWSNGTANNSIFGTVTDVITVLHCHTVTLSHCHSVTLSHCVTLCHTVDCLSVTL